MKVRTLKDVEEMCRVVSGVKELSGTAIKDGRKPRKLSSHDDLPLFVSRIRYPGTQGTHTQPTRLGHVCLTLDARRS